MTPTLAASLPPLGPYNRDDRDEDRPLPTGTAVPLWLVAGLAGWWLVFAVVLS